MKYYGLSIPKLAAYSILWPLCPFSLMLGFTFIICMSGDASQWQYFIGEILFVALLMGGYIYYYRKAFCLYKITPKGISNKHFSIDWEDINSYETYSVDVLLFSSFHKTELTTICAVPAQLIRSYNDLDPHRCVYFEVNRKNIGLIARYCPHPSEAVRELLHRYSDLLNA